MKRKWIRITILSLLLLLPTHGLLSIKAKEVSVGVVVERNFTEDDRFTLELNVTNEGGYIVDGSAWISKGILAYELPVQTKKTFQVKCEKGYKVKSIDYEQPEVGVHKSLLPEVKEGAFDVHTVSTKIVITVTFEKDENYRPDPDPSPDPKPTPSPGDEPTNGGTTNTGPSTGDDTNKGILAITCMGAFSLLLLLYIKRRNKEILIKRRNGRL